MQLFHAANDSLKFREVVIMRKLITTQFARETGEACGILIIYAILHTFTYHECNPATLFLLSSVREDGCIG